MRPIASCTRPTGGPWSTPAGFSWARTTTAGASATRVEAQLGGDFNVFDGFETGPVITRLVEGGLVDTLRTVTDEAVLTFEGNTWAPSGRIDYLFATAPLDVTAAAVATDSASDHRPVSATLAFP